LRILAQDRIFLAFCAAVAFAELTADQWIVTDPLYVNTVLHVPYSLIGAGLAINGLIVVVGQAPMTRASLGHRHTALLGVGAVLYAAGFLLLGLPSVIAIGIIAAFFLSVVVVTLGENLESIPTSTFPSNAAPPTEVGAYNGVFNAFSGVGSLLAPVLGGLVLATQAAPLAVWGLLVLPTIPALLLLAYITPRVSAKANLA